MASRFLRTTISSGGWFREGWVGAGKWVGRSGRGAQGGWRRVQPGMGGAWQRCWHLMMTHLLSVGRRRPGRASGRGALKAATLERPTRRALLDSHPRPQAC